MFRIHIEKDFDGTTANFTVNTKEEFVAVLGSMWDMMAKNIASGDNVWEEILSETGFDSKEEFWKWISSMRDNDMIDSNWNYEEYSEAVVDDWVTSNTDCSSGVDLLADYDRSKDVLDDIYRAVLEVK